MLLAPLAVGTVDQTVTAVALASLAVGQRRASGVAASGLPPTLAPHDPSARSVATALDGPRRPPTTDRRRSCRQCAWLPMRRAPSRAKYLIQKQLFGRIRLLLAAPGSLLDGPREPQGAAPKRRSPGPDRREGHQRQGTEGQGRVWPPRFLVFLAPPAKDREPLCGGWVCFGALFVVDFPLASGLVIGTTPCPRARTASSVGLLAQPIERRGFGRSEGTGADRRRWRPGAGFSRGGPHRLPPSAVDVGRGRAAARPMSARVGDGDRGCVANRDS